MHYIKIVFSLFIVFFLGGNLGATHIVGGEITYRCLGNDMYEIKLSVYRDCFNGVPPFDDPASLGIFNSDYQLLEEKLLEWNQLDDTLLIYLNNPCLTRPPNICVHRTTYLTTAKLPPIPGGYKLVYQRCCRNELIRNIPLPEDVGITIISEITDKAIAECNSSAVYNNWPPLAICVHEPIDFDHGATDPEGDSLVYRLCTPLSGADPLDPMPQPPYNGPYDEVEWKPPYDLTNLLGGDPLTIDPATGFMTGVPNLVGNFVVGVCVDEYRDGEIISITRRDFQYNVADCGVPVAAYTAPVRQCDNLEVNFVNQTQLNDLGISNWYFDWGGNLGLFSDQYSPSFTYPDTGQYQVALIVNPGYSCSDTIIQNVWITETQADANIDLDFIECDENGATLQLNDQSTDPIFGISGVSWRVTGPGNLNFLSGTPDTSVVLTTAGTYNVRLTATGGNGCQDVINVPVNLPFSPGQILTDTYSICAGDSIPLYPNANPNLNYTWLPNPEINDITAANPVVSPESTTTYTVKIVQSASTCEWTRMVTVQVLGPGQLSATANPVSILKGQSSQLNAVFPGNVSYQWTPEGSLSDPNIANPVATPEITTDYTVTTTSTSGCTNAVTVRVVVIDPFCDDPYIFFPTGFSPNGDNENDVLRIESRFIDEVYWMVYNRWGEKVFEAFNLTDAWDGTYKGQAQPMETYGYYYRVRCLDGTVTEKKGNVTLIR